MPPPTADQPAVPAPFDRKMNIVTVFDPVRMIRTHTVSGRIGLAAFRSILQGLYGSKQFNPDMNALWDLRQADFSAVTPENVRELMHIVVSLWGRSGRCRSAILVATEAEFGVARTYASQFGATAPCQIRIFLELAEARAWIGLVDAPDESVPLRQPGDSPAAP